jgi:hypothetical protein
MSHVILLGLIKTAILDAEHKLQSSSLCNFLLPYVTASVFNPEFSSASIFLTTLLNGTFVFHYVKCA